MARSKDVNIVESLESKLDVIINTLNTLVHKTIEIEEFFARFYSDARLEVGQSMIQLLFQASTSNEVVEPIFQQENPPIQ